MRNIVLVFIFFTILGCSNTAKEDKVVESNEDLNSAKKADSIMATNLVREFFKAFDSRDYGRLEQILAPNSKIIHFNGVTTGTSEMLDILKETENWYPRRRNLSNFEFDGDENFAVVGIINEVTFLLPEGKEVYEPYNETWVLKKIDNEWHVIRSHYSKIIEEKHTEDVE